MNIILVINAFNKEENMWQNRTKHWYASLSFSLNVGSSFSGSGSSSLVSCGSFSMVNRPVSSIFL